MKLQLTGRGSLAKLYRKWCGIHKISHKQLRFFTEIYKERVLTY